MDQAEILAFITQVETEDVEPIYAAKVYAAALDDMQDRITAQDLKRLLLVGAAMFRSCAGGKYVELQLPASVTTDDERDLFENEPFKGVLH